MYRIIKSNNNDQDYIFAMANVRGNKVKVPHKLPFSFYFSPKNSSHSIRVKVVFNPDRIHINTAGNLELHGSYIFTPNEDDKHVNSKDLKCMLNFFKEYKVLFAAVWEDVLQEDVLQEYFRGFISFDELICEFDFYSHYDIELNDIHDVSTLETFVRDNNIFNMND